MPSLRVPELHPAVLTPTHDPRPIRRKCHTKHEILVPLKHPHALPARRLRARLQPLLEIPVAQLPHPDRLVQTAGDQVSAVGREGNAVHAVFVALLAFRSLDHDRRLAVPDAHAFVEGAGGDVAAVWGDGYGGHAVFDLEGQDALVLLDVPESDRAVAGAGCDVAAVGGEVEGVDVLVVAREGVVDGLGGDVPYLDHTC